MASNEIKILLMEEELVEFKECMKYQYGENYMENPEVVARIEVMENMIKILKEKNNER
ncbi:hypothetical protein CLHOM_34720 [Clostridium homopropionicum DSM 5847]|uniref:Uncharacterized protein n=1 Tax=Clostridium homopropionicum DSM 5847 TaxID=1121318 RepID=A0A0L6Z6I5_9CLOT|nr:hypothetical protein [Clostridium homopropionicum]KOA18570.1 hypothetical protein CLHOM_34720 [Clostridium homopropionicum DSM 5847]SFF64646.1 hypothetical protein SAMN04488501_1018 [Clostridium homopropionicum]